MLLAFLQLTVALQPASLAPGGRAAARGARAVAAVAVIDAKKSAGARRRERRRRWWAEREEAAEERPGASAASDGRHPLEALLDASERADLLDEPPAQGDRLMVTALGSSALGLAVETVACGRAGLVYAEEAAYPPGGGFDGAAPVSVGDTVPAFVQKVREDGRLDLCFRPVDAKQRLHEAAAAVLAATAAAAARGEALPLGDASEPHEVRRHFPGLSKASFKQAVGHLLREGLVAAPLQPRETALAPAHAALGGGAAAADSADAADSAADAAAAAAATWPAHLPPPPRRRGKLLLEGLPRRCAGPVGAAALLALLDEVAGGALELRRAAGGGAWATVRDGAAADAALAALRAAAAPPWALSEEEAAELSAARQARGGAEGRRGARVFVGNLAEQTSEDDLWDAFGDVGYIEAVSLGADERTGRCRGFAHVQFQEGAAAAAALRLGGLGLHERPLRVELAEEDADGARAAADAAADAEWLRARFAPRQPAAAAPGAPGAPGGPAALEVEEIEATLARREVLRRARDYEGADALRQGLWEAGVRVDDAAREWQCRLSGRSGRIASLVERWLHDGAPPADGAGERALSSGRYEGRGGRVDGRGGRGRGGRGRGGRGRGGRGRGGRDSGVRSGGRGDGALGMGRRGGGGGGW